MTKKNEEDQAEGHRLKPSRNADPVKPAPGGALRGPLTVGVEMLVAVIRQSQCFPQSPLPRREEERGAIMFRTRFRAARTETRSSAQDAMNSFHLRTM